MTRNNLIVCFSLFFMLIISVGNAQPKIFHEHYYNNSMLIPGELPITSNDLFTGSGNCLLCHNDQVNSVGESVSIIADWRSTMMANASRDPFWRAKVSHEGLVNPVHKEALENVCTRCHAPTGNENAHFLGQTYYSIADMENDPLALDGVQCTACHQITTESMGNYSGTFEIGTEHTIWGPYETPFANPMIMETGYTPVFGNHITDSRLCGGCHTLITNSVDNSGNPTGNQFVEQAIYHEWLNSDYSTNNETCQSCHVPRIDDPVKISTRPPSLDPRTPFGMHHFAGANTFMVNMIKENGEELGVTANDTQFDSTLSRNTQMLREKSVLVDLEVIDRTLDTLYLKLSLENITGHKFPSGYPSRRVTVELIIRDNNDTIFHNGKFDESGNLLFEDANYERHHNIINTEQQVQIYELVMGDINYDVTTILERANFTLKDNRIPPIGFTTTHSAYDTVQIVGLATDDPNFNNLFGEEGTGSDILYFNVSTLGITNDLNIITNIYYQTVNPRWLSNMFSYSSDEIDLFKDFYNTADKSPTLVTSTELLSNYTNIIEEKPCIIRVFPNPTSSQVSVIADDIIQSISIFNYSGVKIIPAFSSGNSSVRIQMPSEKGIYLVYVKTATSQSIQKVIVN